MTKRVDKVSLKPETLILTFNSYGGGWGKPETPKQPEVAKYYIPEKYVWHFWWFVQRIRKKGMITRVFLIYRYWRWLKRIMPDVPWDTAEKWEDHLIPLRPYITKRS